MATLVTDCGIRTDTPLRSAVTNAAAQQRPDMDGSATPPRRVGRCDSGVYATMDPSRPWACASKSPPLYTLLAAARLGGSSPQHPSSSQKHASPSILVAHLAAKHSLRRAACGSSEGSSNGNGLIDQTTTAVSKDGRHALCPGESHNAARAIQLKHRKAAILLRTHPRKSIRAVDLEGPTPPSFMRRCAIVPRACIRA